MNLLENAKIENVVNEPITYLHCRNVLPVDLYQELSETYPENICMEGKNADQVGIPRYDVSDLDRSNLTDTWLKFLDYNTSQEYYNDVIKLLSAGIKKDYPEYFNNIVNLPTSIRGPRMVKKSAILDFQFVINGTIQKDNSPRTPHLDNFKQLWVLLFYMRKENDKSTGGDFTIYKSLVENIEWHGKREANIDQIEPIYTVPYEANSFILVLNNINSIHGVTPRVNPTEIRRYINTTCHTPIKLINL